MKYFAKMEAGKFLFFTQYDDYSDRDGQKTIIYTVANICKLTIGRHS
jgi:hypothetical protein